MKKQYIAPSVEIEHFQLDKEIAASCIVNLTNTAYTCDDFFEKIFIPAPADDCYYTARDTFEQIARFQFGAWSS